MSDWTISRLLNELSDPYGDNKEDAAIMRRAAELISAMQWQPIETAPKSTSTDVPGGKHVEAVYLLGFCPEEGISPAGCIEVIWWEPNMDGGVWCASGFAIKPTHWMPLPEPPK